eukprot:XP_011674576.1 PREDICTED: DNA-directed RNA polymerase II subunit RPB1-like [Strongylocentrotus purpuratus]
MTKTGKPDSYWDHLMRLYARGQHRFSVGKSSGGKKWKEVKKRIDACPLHLRKQALGVFGTVLSCKCGYHEQPKKSSGGLPTSQPRQPKSPLRQPTSPPRQPTSPPRQPTSPPRQPTSPPRQTTSQPRRPTSPPRQPTSPPRQTTSQPRQPTSPPRQPTSPPRQTTSQPRRPTSPPRQQTLECGLCRQNVNIEDFTDHLDMYHAQVTCQVCGRLCRGEEGLTQHIKDAHSKSSRVSTKHG